MKEKLHIIPHDHHIDRDTRQKTNGHQSCVIWFTGLSGSGKSTLANALETELVNKGYHTYLLDGDNVRTGLNSDLDFSAAARKENIRRIGEVAKLMDDAGLITLAAFVSPYREEREFVRSLLGDDHYIEVYVDCPVEECEKRDVKGLYKKARAGEISNFTGISAPFEAPEDPDIRVQTHLQSIEEGVQTIMEHLNDKLKLK
ncbi:MAG TPA: adenylyl-sulfate kinase [Cryomorphaceae bacterium]|nr:adenylyl-sulfate kinase [Owenweeksia sp.]HAD96469.1 adenylyl-sulfate kinase [Cryomorphaceae bacterium]HBF19647.1 adenylyl-sulfate kinase [Cryomorphaceae bacterium]HCQ15984.1 adenylyl-sulfate kinase [Cryomorphaceae bacterium]